MIRKAWHTTVKDAVMNAGVMRSLQVDQPNGVENQTTEDFQCCVDNPSLAKANPDLWSLPCASDRAMHRLYCLIVNNVIAFCEEYHPEWVGQPFKTFAWCNWYPEGSNVPMHDHGSTDLVVTYYLDGEGEFRFDDPDLETIKTAPGLLVVFPGHLRHESLPNPNSKHRVVIATNINFGEIHDDRP